MFASVRVGVLALLLCVACQKREVLKPVGNYSFDMTVVNFDIPEQGAEVVYEDSVLARIKPKAPTARITLPEDVYLVEAKGRLRIRVEGTCGKQDLPLRIPFADRQQEAKATRSQPQAAEFEVENATVAKVYFDNDGSPATALTIGAYNMDVPSGDRGVLTAILGTCATARQVFVAGAKVGDLPREPVSTQAPLAALVDLKGGRCYRKRQHTYDATGTETKRVEPKAAPPVPASLRPAPGKAAAKLDAGAPPMPTDDKEGAILKGQRVYAVGVIQDFLMPSPEKLVVLDDTKALVRNEVLHCEDVNAKAKAPAKLGTLPAKPAAAVVAKKPPPQPPKKKK